MIKTKDLRGPALARAVLDHIEDLERRKAAGERTFAHWDQGEWGYVIEPGMAEDGVSCGTSMCFAGWACQLAGVPMKVEPGSFNSYNHKARLVVDNGTHWGADIEKVAAELLELPTTDDADYGRLINTRIFDGSNDLDDLREYVKQIEDGTYVNSSWWLQGEEENDDA